MVQKFMYLMELFLSWAFSIFILPKCMFLSNTPILVRWLVWVVDVLITHRVSVSHSVSVVLNSQG